MLSITWHDERLLLHPDKAVFWERESTLLITDPHFGKESSFQHAGIPIPYGSTESDLNRLAALVHQTRAERLIILGDFFHNRHSQNDIILGSLLDWRRQHSSLQCILIRGNHDRHAGDPPDELGIECVTEPFAPSVFSFYHHPPKEPVYASFAGHIHPSISLYDSIGMRIRSACFFFEKNLALLPAFGSFTGTYTLKAKKGDRVFAVGDQQIIEISYKD